MDNSALNGKLEERVGSTARVVTDRPGRYGKQLASHFGKNLPASWSSEEGRGSISFVGEGVGSKNPKRAFDGVVNVSLVAGDGVLLMQLDSPAEIMERFERVVGGHLVRFGSKEELHVEWRRMNGEPGSVQSLS